MVNAVYYMELQQASCAALLCLSAAEAEERGSGAKMAKSQHLLTVCKTVAGAFKLAKPGLTSEKDKVTKYLAENIFQHALILSGGELKIHLHAGQNMFFVLALPYLQD